MSDPESPEEEPQDEEQEQPDDNDWTGPYRTPGLGY